MQLELAVAAVFGIVLSIMFMTPERHQSRAPMRHMVGLNREQLRAIRLATAASATGAEPSRVVSVSQHAQLPRQSTRGVVDQGASIADDIVAELLPKAS